MRNQFADAGAKNQLQENVRRMREIQKKNRQKEAEKQAEPVKVMWKSEKYSGVESKIKMDIQQCPSAPRPGSARDGYLRAHSRAGPPVKLESRPCTPDTAASLRRSVPLASDAGNVKMQRNNFDFIKVNGINARRANVARPPSACDQENNQRRKEELLQSHEFGQVPTYLRKRQSDWAKQAETRRLNTPDPAMPPGHREMPDKERRETLQLLHAKQTEVINNMQKLPIGADTVRVKQQRMGLEAQLTEVEEAIKIFSRPKVFVRVDS